MQNSHITKEVIVKLCKPEEEQDYKPPSLTVIYYQFSWQPVSAYSTVRNTSHFSKNISSLDKCTWKRTAAPDTEWVKALLSLVITEFDSPLIVQDWSTTIPI